MWILTLLVGLVIGLVIGWRWPGRGSGSHATAGGASGAGVVPELVLRANRGEHLCVMAEAAGAEHWVGEHPLDLMDRGKVESVASLAAADGRRHVVRDERMGCIVGVGSQGVGAALLVPRPSLADDDVERIGDDLIHLLDGRPLAPERLEERQAYRPAVDSVAGIGFDLAERARGASGHPCVVVHRPPGGEAVVVAGSTGTDRRLVGERVSAGSLAARACDAEQMVTGGDNGDIISSAGADRRRSGRGVAIPLRDGNQGVGALVVLAPPETLAERAREELVQAVARLSPSFAAASAIKTAEDRSVTDPLTGLPNRTALARAMNGWGSGPCSLLGVDIDHFKSLNDTYGHAAGDSALRHVAGIFRRALRDRDLPARVGGEEFALWLPGVSQGAAVEVAERVREMVQEVPWEVDGKRVGITCSIGVASVPETTRSADNLVTAADAALYRAKERGRNRVEVASGEPRPSTPGDR